MRTGVTRQTMRLLSPEFSAPNWNVSVCAAAAPADSVLLRSLLLPPGAISFGYLYSRIHTGRFGSARFGSSTRMSNALSLFGSPAGVGDGVVWIGTARFGIVSSP